MDRECIACGDMVKPTYHKGDGKTKLPCVLLVEHLHYYCRCGYDFTGKLKSQV